MPDLHDQADVIDREIAEIDNRIAEMQTEGRDNKDEAISELREKRKELERQREDFLATAPVDRTDREDPVTGRDLQDQTQKDAVIQGLRR